MFNMFSWGQYMGLVAVLLALYYLYVGAVYYRAELMGLLKGKVPVAPAPAAHARPSLVGPSAPLIPKAALPLPESPPAEPMEGPNEEIEIDEIKNTTPVLDNITSFTQQSDDDGLPAMESEPEGTAGKFEPDFSVGVAQLSDYLEAAGEGKITQTELVEQLPELENTSLLVAFFQANAKTAQRLTSQRYVAVAEPVLD